MSVPVYSSFANKLLIDRNLRYQRGHRTAGVVALVALLILLPGCGSAKLAARPFQVQDVAKSDLAMVMEAHQQQVLTQLQLLTKKLYQRNPRELRKQPAQILPDRLAAIFYNPLEIDWTPTGGQRNIAAMRLAFDPEFHGDRVYAFCAGMTDMIMSAYGHRQTFYTLNDIDAQKLYDSARNVEIAAWKINHDRSPTGELFLLSNSRPGEVQNYSFERLLGKIIAQQDSIARIAANRSNHNIKNLMQTIAGVVFIPI
ncbi:MAG: hypothetical protein J4A00_02020 [Gammaproteobacteria bacterium]|nr:hypothetical protein [Gammaproteobacteria bacterium]